MAIQTLEKPAVYDKDGVRAKWDGNVDKENAMFTEIYGILTPGVTGAFTLVSALQVNAGNLEKKTVTVTVTAGVVTAIGAESAWSVVGAV